MISSKDSMKGFFSRKDHGGYNGEFLKEQFKQATENMKQDKMIIDDFPRRSRLPFCIPAEMAITNAVNELEKVGADIKLTEAVILLGKARDLLSDYVDSQLQSK